MLVKRPEDGGEEPAVKRLILGVCGQCRRRVLLMAYAGDAVMLLFGIPALILCGFGSTGTALRAAWMPLPVLVFAAVTAAGFFAGKAVTAGLRKKYRRTMYPSVRKIPLVRERMEEGYEILPQDGKTTEIFAK